MSKIDVERIFIVSPETFFQCLNIENLHQSHIKIVSHLQYYDFVVNATSIDFAITDFFLLMNFGKL